MQSAIMADQAKLQAQRSDGNVYAFRRLKWSDPPAQFRVENILRRGFVTPVEPSRTVLDGDRPGVEVQTSPTADMREEPGVADLDKRRARERFIDAMIWGAAIVSVSAFVVALVWTGLGG